MDMSRQIIILTVDTLGETDEDKIKKYMED